VTQAPEPLKRVDADGVRGYEVAQIELNGKGVRARFEQFRDLRTTQAASQSHEASIGLLSDADPAIHGAAEGKTQATAGRTWNQQTRLPGLKFWRRHAVSYSESHGPP
jgi:hypothetical protein